MIKSYKELSQLRTFEERFNYLRIGGHVGKQTFGMYRYLNQVFYKTGEWRAARRDAILRDDGCDLGLKGHEIYDKIIVHHINPITIEDIENGNPIILDPNNLISTSHNTSNALHYGDASLLITLPPERRKGDTCPWKVY